MTTDKLLNTALHDLANATERIAGPEVANLYREFADNLYPEEVEVATESEQ